MFLLWGEVLAQAITVPGRDNSAYYSADGLARVDTALQSAVMTLYALQAAMMTLLEYSTVENSATKVSTAHALVRPTLTITGSNTASVPSEPSQSSEKLVSSQ